MSYYVIIRGPMGVGKSTIAQNLAKHLKGTYISIDQVLEKYGLDKVDKDAECIPAENFIKAQEMIMPEVKKKLKNKVIVFDACFYHKAQIEHLLKNLPEQHYVFTLKADVETCVERDRNRSKQLGELAARAVHSLVSRFDYGIVIDTKNKSIDETLNEIIGYLPK